MKTSPHLLSSVFYSLLIAGIYPLLSGCGDAADSTTPKPSVATSDSAAKPTNASPNHWLSEVTLTLPDVETGSTLELRAEGKCNLPLHDRQNRFEFELLGRMSYRVGISSGSHGTDEWDINPLVDVTNESGSLLYARYYAAFFNKAGQLVGCCNQGIDLESSAKPMQLGSLVIKGPKEKLLSATRFQIVIYESDQRIGVEPLSADLTATLVGRSGKVIGKLEQTDSTVLPCEGHRELRLQAKLTYEEPVEKNRHTHLRIQGAAEYDVYVSTANSERVIQKTDGKGQVLERERFNSWETSVEFDQQRRVKGVSNTVHAAVLDESGRLIVCGTFSPSRLAAPEDKLLSASRLDMVVYEAGGSVPAPAQAVAPQAPRKAVNERADMPKAPFETVQARPETNPTRSETAEDTPPVGTLPEIDRPDDKGFARLHRAAMDGNVDATKELIAAGANINVPQQQFKGTPLQYAAARGHLDVIKLLVEAGATVDSKDTLNRTPIYWAVKEVQPPAAGLLLEAGSDPFDRTVRSTIEQLKSSDSKELVDTFDDYFAKQSSERWLRWQVASASFTVELQGRIFPLFHAAEPALRYPATGQARATLAMTLSSNKPLSNAIK